MAGSYAPRHSSLPVVTTVVCLICALIFGAIHLHLAGTWGAFSDTQIYEGAWWGMITSAFVHVEVLHIAFNLYWFWYLGGAMERALGPFYTALFVLVAAFVSSGLQMAVGEGGIGLSGVVYAVFAFAWVTRRRWPEFALIANAQNAQLFAGWAVLCVVLTKMHVLNIGNGAHIGGAFFGAALGAAVEYKSKLPLRIASIAAAILIAGLSAVPLFYSPFSVSWVGIHAEKERVSGDTAGAIALYRRATDLDDQADWAWHDLAILYMAQNDRPHAEEALGRLKQLDPADGARLAQELGLQP